jgi:hypothetical protein
MLEIKSMKPWHFVLINSFLLAVTILSLALGSVYDVPDLLRINYGFPLIWGWNTRSTISGPVDIWYVDAIMLAVDLFLWLTIIISVDTYLFTRERKSDTERIGNNCEEHAQR